MKIEELEIEDSNLLFRIPLLGKYFHLRAVKKLTKKNIYHAFSYLFKAINSIDPRINKVAVDYFLNLKNENEVDEFCSMWYETREKQLENILLSTGYMAARPLEIMVATALKTNRPELCDNPRAIEFLLKFLNDNDRIISQNALKALRFLKNSDSIDKLCKTWYNNRDSQLEEIISSSKFIAEKPFEIWIATALLSGRTDLCNKVPSLEFVVKFMNDKNATILQNADQTLRTLKKQNAIGTLCDGIISGSMDAAKSIAVEMNYQPVNVSKRCLFFVMSGQIEKYFDLDYEFQYLRAEYMAAPEILQKRIRSVIQQSSDPGLMSLFGEVRKKFVAKELSEHEAELMIEVYARNQQMEEIFSLLFFVPLIVVVKALDVLIHNNWKSPEENSQLLLTHLFDTRYRIGEKPELPPPPNVSLGSVFQKWIETGLTKLVSKSEAELRESLKYGTPSEAVSALSAMKNRKLINKIDHEIINNHPHWVVPLVYSVHEYFLSDGSFSGKQLIKNDEDIHWLTISPLLFSDRLLQLRAVNITPDHLQELMVSVEKTCTDNTIMNHYGSLLILLSGYTLRNVITIGKYEKQIEDTAISI